MMESHLFEGNQQHADDPTALRYGVSITDACIGWDETAALLRDAARTLQSTRRVEAVSAD
jgi:3-deoxy-7-phosphoheptulonate synthase